MSKYVKDLVVQDLQRRLDGVDDAVLVDVIGLDANTSVLLRRQLREKEISLVVVKSSLAKRATEGTPLHAAFNDMEGSLAVVWGGEDFVSLVKEVTKLDKAVAEFDAFQAKGGVLDGEHLSAKRVKEISKWPSREELVAIVAGQAIGIGSEVAGQLIAPAEQIASQIEKLIEMKEQEE
ncbi:MAG: 50S ribosomal protein L10 [Planctomycetaceae bacterium]|nr:50S ribosomal protein L10 [Planctomycetaceae bacterium]